MRLCSIIGISADNIVSNERGTTLVPFSYLNIREA